MTQEQKAKAYDEVIEKLRDFYRDYDTISHLIDVKEELANLIPELKESEDEKIKKEIISFLKEGKPYYCPNSVRRQEWIAWLENQGKHKASVVDFKAKDWYVSKVDGKIYNAKFMEKNPINQARKLEIEKAAMSATGIIEQEEWFIKGAEWSDKNPSYISSDKSVKIKGFVAVDNCGDKTIINPTGRRVAFFPKKPVRDLLTNNHYWAAHISPYDVIHLDYRDFPELKWEDEPIEVEITINKD